MNTRNRQFFPQLSGLARKLDAVIEAAPKSSAINAATNLRRPDADIQERLDKQAAKRARRAAAARKAGLIALVLLLGSCYQCLAPAQIDAAVRSCRARGGTPDFVHYGRAANSGPIVRVDCWGTTR